MTARIVAQDRMRAAHIRVIGNNRFTCRENRELLDRVRAIKEQQWARQAQVAS